MVTRTLGATSDWYRLTDTALVVERQPGFEEWMAFGQMLGGILRSAHFWLGDWLNYGEQTWGETYAQAMEEYGFAYQTCANDKSICRRLTFRQPGLSFSHHAEVASLPAMKQSEMLAEAMAKSWTTAELRKAIDQRRNGKMKTALPAVILPQVFLAPVGCALSGYGIPCDGPMQTHHVLGKGWAKGVPREAIEQPELMIDVCYAHNVGKWADHREARRILLVQAIYRHGWKRIAAIVDAVPWKVHLRELAIENMLEPIERT